MIVKSVLRHLLFLCICANLLAENLDEKTIKVISLGGSCHTAIALRDLDLRKEAYPLDWIISTNHTGFVNILRDDFEHIFDKECVETTFNNIPLAHNLYYDFYFPHDFGYSEDQQAEWTTFQQKYTRRIERFRALRSYKGKVIFVRVFWDHPSQNDQGQFSENSKRALETRDALDEYFPDLDYILVIWSHADLDIPPMEPIDRVMELRLPKAHHPFLTEISKLLDDRHLT